MEKICEVSNPEFVLKQLKKYYGNEVDLYLSSSKNKKYVVFNEDGKKIPFGSIIHEDFTKHKDKKEEITLEHEIRNGKILISIHQHIYHIICCGDYFTKLK